MYLFYDTACVCVCVCVLCMLGRLYADVGEANSIILGYI